MRRETTTKEIGRKAKASPTIIDPRSKQTTESVNALGEYAFAACLVYNHHIRKDNSKRSFASTYRE